MTIYEQLKTPTLRASEAIGRDGRLRSGLRRANRACEIIGYEAVENFVVAIKHVVRIPDEVADGCMVLIAHRNVMQLKVTDEKKPPSPDTLAWRLGEKVGDQRRRLSELRLQRLLRARDHDDRLQQMRRALSLLDTPIHPLPVVQAYIDLSDEHRRRRFVNAYFTGSSAFETDDQTQATTTQAA